MDWRNMKNNIKEVDDLLNEFKETDAMENIVVESYKEEAIELTNITIKIAKFNNV